jgi:uncharacterized protein (TIGR02996 family)
MSDGASLLAFCRQHPDDDQARLVYADWLEEHGEPERAEFVRLGRQIQGMPQMHPQRERLSRRADRLLEANRARWCTGVPAALRRAASFRGGTSLEVTLDAAAYLASGRRLLDKAGVRGVCLLNPAGQLREIERAGLLKGLHRLTLSGGDLGRQLGREDLVVLAECPDLAGLRSLVLDCGRIPPAVARCLCRSPHLAGLRELDLYGALPTWPWELAQPEAAPSLRSLRMRNTEARTPIAAGHLEALANSPRMAGLRDLELANYDLDEEAVTAFAAGGALTSLRSLRLSECRLTPPAVARLLASPVARNLTCLSLASNRLGPEGAQVIAAAELDGLECLDLAEAGVGPEGLAALAGSPHLAGLRSLSLARLGRYGYTLLDAGVQALARSKLRRLTDLDLSDNNLVSGRRGMPVLADSPVTADLRRLNLSGCGVGDAGAKAIASSPHLGRLEEVHLDRAGITAEGAKELAASTALGALQVLRLADNELGQDGARAFVDSPLCGHVRELVLIRCRIAHDMRDRLKERWGDRVRF